LSAELLPGEFTADRRIVSLSGLAIACGEVSACLAWLLLRLNYFLNDLF
jgi:hypothetical protein